MNANELAEIQAFKTEELTMWERNQTATMLRQQQAEIEVFTKYLEETCQIGKFIVWNSTEKDLADEQ